MKNGFKVSAAKQLRKALCAVGAHGWEFDYKFGKRHRTCKHCGKQQYQFAIIAGGDLTMTDWEDAVIGFETAMQIREDEAICKEEFDLMCVAFRKRKESPLSYYTRETPFGGELHLRRADLARWLTSYMKERLYACEDLQAKWTMDVDGNAYIGDLLFIQNFGKSARFHRHVFSY